MEEGRAVSLAPSDPKLLRVSFLILWNTEQRHPVLPESHP